MDTQLVGKLAREYMRLVDEGWSPDLDEFLGRVPRELREPCRLQIEERMGSAQPEAPAEAEALPGAVEFSLDAAADVDEEPEGPVRVYEIVPEHVEPEPVDVMDEVPEPIDEPVVPEGPQPLTREEALAMWDSQLAGT